MWIKEKKKTIQVWNAGRKWDINNLKTNPDEIEVTWLSSWAKSRKETAQVIAKMNEVKLMNWITWGRKRKYTPNQLLDKINEYFMINMIFREVYDDSWKVIDVVFDRMRAMSVFWLCNHLEISYSSFREMASTSKYWLICLQAKQKIMDQYIVGWLEGQFDSKVASVIVNMQMQNERIEAGLQEEKNKWNLFQKIEVNIVTKDWEVQKKVDPIKVITVPPKS